MSMVDNYDTTVNAIKRFIYANAPAGAECDIDNLENRQSGYFSLEFRRDDVSVTLYIELDGFAATCVVDDEGNRWRQCALEVKPSWPSYGSVEPDRAERFLTLLSKVNAFGKALKAEFGEPINKLVETAEQLAVRKAKAAEETSRHEVQRLMRVNAKGMRVGHERHVDVPVSAPDLLPVGEVTLLDSGRYYTARVTATRTFTFRRTS